MLNSILKDQPMLKFQKEKQLNLILFFQLLCCHAAYNIWGRRCDTRLKLSYYFYTKKKKL